MLQFVRLRAEVFDVAVLSVLMVYYYSTFQRKKKEVDMNTN